MYVPFRQHSENEQRRRTCCSPPWHQELISFSQPIVGTPENRYKENKKTLIFASYNIFFEKKYILSEKN